MTEFLGQKIDVNGKEENPHGQRVVVEAAVSRTTTHTQTAFIHETRENALFAQQNVCVRRGGGGVQVGGEEWVSRV